MIVVNLTALAEARAKMTPGEYRYAVPSLGVIESPDGGPTPYITKPICEMYSQNAGPNADGLVATHNAATVLIEVVRAAKSWADSDDEDRADELDAMLAALAKVTL